MSGGRLPPSNAFSVGQQQPYLNHDAGSHFQSSPSDGAFVQPEKKGLGQESQYTARVNSQAQSVPQEMNPALRGEEISNDRFAMSPKQFRVLFSDVNFYLSFRDSVSLFSFSFEKRSEVTRIYKTRKTHSN